MRILCYGRTDRQTDGAGFIGPAGRQGGSKNRMMTKKPVRLYNEVSNILSVTLCSVCIGFIDESNGQTENNNASMSLSRLRVPVHAVISQP